MRQLDLRSRFKADVLRKKHQRVPIDWETLEYVFEEMISGRGVPEMLNPHPLHSESFTDSRRPGRRFTASELIGSCSRYDLDVAHDSAPQGVRRIERLAA